MAGKTVRDTRVNIGPVLLWGGERSWSLHVNKLRVFWIKDARSGETFSDRQRLGHVRYFGSWIVRWWESQ